MAKLPEWESKDARFKEIATRLTDMANAINSCLMITGSRGVSVANTSAGKTISMRWLDGPAIHVFLGIITDTGPNGDEDDYTDARYWVKPADL